MRAILPISLLAIICFVGIASATPVTVNNPSFEALVLSCTAGPSCFVDGDIPGWVPSVFLSTATFKPSTGLGGEFSSIPDGANVAAVGNELGGANIFQALTATVQANMLYMLDVSVGARADFPFSQYTIALEAGGAVLASDSSLNPSAGSFLPDAITFFSGPTPTTLGQQLGIRLSATGLSVTGAEAQADFDKVLLDASPSTSIPEPSTLYLLAAGCIGLLSNRCFRRRGAISHEMLLPGHNDQAAFLLVGPGRRFGKCRSAAIERPSATASRRNPASASSDPVWPNDCWGQSRRSGPPTTRWLARNVTGPAPFRGSWPW